MNAQEFLIRELAACERSREPKDWEQLALILAVTNDLVMPDVALDDVKMVRLQQWVGEACCGQITNREPLFITALQLATYINSCHRPS